MTETTHVGARGLAHPHYSGKGTDGRHYRPVWHAVEGVVGDE